MRELLKILKLKKTDSHNKVSRGSESSSSSSSSDGFLESLPSNFPVHTGHYREGRLSRALTVSDQWGPHRGTSVWKLLCRFFAFHRRKMTSVHLGGKQAGGGGDGRTKEEEKKRRSSWLPDPEKRWPVQGW